MFNRLVTIRIKAAEDAFAAGRLEEAFEIASSPDLAGQRTIRSLLKQVAEALLNRGQDHLMSRRFTEAVADFERAGRCGLLNEKAAEWHRRALQAMLDDRKAQGEKAEAIAAAKGRLAAGSIVGAADALARSPIKDADGAAISAEIGRQAERARSALDEAKSALRDGHLAEAVQRFRIARASHAKLDGIAEMEARLVEEVVGTAQKDYQEGRLLLAKQELDTLGDVGQSRPQRIELVEAIRLAQEAAKAVREDRFSRAGVLLGRLTQIAPKADWVSAACKQLETLEDQRRTLLTGPLGLLLGREAPGVDATSAGERETVIRRDRRIQLGAPAILEGGDPGNGRLPRRLLVRIDGVGSFLLVRGERVSIGRAGQNSSADVGLLSDLSERHAEIVRSGEDYFVMSTAGVELAGRPVDHALLQDGDRLRLGRHIRLKFLKPSRKSPAAVIELGEGVRMTTDCRRAILWAGPLLLGSTRECHIHLGAASESLVLIDRGDHIAVKPMGPGGVERPLTLGSQIEMGEVRFSIQEYRHVVSA